MEMNHKQKAPGLAQAGLQPEQQTEHSPGLSAQAEVQSLGLHHACISWGPLAPGQGRTLGTALRRLLLARPPVCYATEVVVADVCSPGQAPQGLQGDLELLLFSLRCVPFRLLGEDSAVLRLRKSGEGKVTAADLEVPACVDVLNTDFVLAQLGPGGTLDLQITLQRAQAPVPQEQAEPPAPSGQARRGLTEPVDGASVAPRERPSPVLCARWSVRALESQQGEQLLLEVQTDGRLTPGEAVGQAAKVLADQAGALAARFEGIPGPFDGGLPVSEGVRPIAFIPFTIRGTVSELNLPPRTVQSLKAMGIESLADLIQNSEEELLRTPDLGRKHVRQIQAALAERGLCLGARLEVWPPVS